MSLSEEMGTAQVSSWKPQPLPRAEASRAKSAQPPPASRTFTLRAPPAGHQGAEAEPGGSRERSCLSKMCQEGGRPQPQPGGSCVGWRQLRAHRSGSWGWTRAPQGWAEAPAAAVGAPHRVGWSWRRLRLGSTQAEVPRPTQRPSPPRVPGLITVSWWCSGRPPVPSLAWSAWPESPQLNSGQSAPPRQPSA